MCNYECFPLPAVIEIVPLIGDAKSQSCFVTCALDNEKSRKKSGREGLIE